MLYKSTLSENVDDAKQAPVRRLIPMSLPQANSVVENSGNSSRVADVPPVLSSVFG